VQKIEEWYKHMSISLTTTMAIILADFDVIMIGGLAGAYAERHSPPHPYTPAEDNTVAQQAVPTERASSTDSCTASIEAGIVGLINPPASECYTNRQQQSAQGECLVQPVPIHEPDEEQGAADFACGHPSD
jgi:hypothetical protein